MFIIKKIIIGRIVRRWIWNEKCKLLEIFIMGKNSFGNTRCLTCVLGVVVNKLEEIRAVRVVPLRDTTIYKIQDVTKKQTDIQL